MGIEKISGDTHLKEFSEIYNSNNEYILQYIQTLESKISSLENDIKKVKENYTRKFNYIDSQLKNIIEKSKEEISKDYNEKYNTLLNYVESLHNTTNTH